MELRRLTRSRALGVVALSAAVGVGAAACGGSSPQAGGTTSLTQSNGSGASIVLAADQSTTAKKSAKVSLTEQVDADGHKVVVTANGSEDFADHAFDLVTTVSGQQLEIRDVGQTLYEKLPASVSRMLPGGKPWISVDLNTITKSLTGSSLSQLQSASQTDPANVLGYLKGVSASGVHQAGTATIRGVPTTAYKVTVDLNKAVSQEPAAAQAAVKALIQKLGTSTFPMTIWVDSSRVVRQVSFHLAVGSAATGSATVDATMQLYDFGTAVNVTAPPASQSTDITGKIAQVLGEGGSST